MAKKSAVSAKYNWHTQQPRKHVTTSSGHNFPKLFYIHSFQMTLTRYASICTTAGSKSFTYCLWCTALSSFWRAILNGQKGAHSFVTFVHLVHTLFYKSHLWEFDKTYCFSLHSNMPCETFISGETTWDVLFSIIYVKKTCITQNVASQKCEYGVCNVCEETFRPCPVGSTVPPVLGMRWSSL